MTMNDGTLPGCFSLRTPTAPNRCETCKFADACKKYVAKERLKPLVSKILEVQEILRGERFE